MKKTAIVITAFNRDRCLNYLLTSLSKIDTKDNISLFISIDCNGSNKVLELAKNFFWKFGEKKIIQHKSKLGLVNHFIWVGEQTKNFDNIIFLEDDLLVSPNILSFCNQLIDFYKHDPMVAAVSLYSPIINEITGTRFYPLPDSTDVFFLQQPYWGNIWFKDKWKNFSDYLIKYKENKKILPFNVASWKKSFKKIYIQYLIEKNLFVVTPRTSLLTNQCVEGLHSSGRGGYFHTCLETLNYKYRLIKCNDSLAKYDAFMEINPDSLKRFNSNLSKYDFDVDLNGSKTHYEKEYILTSKGAFHSIFSFSSIMKPLESSIIFDIQCKNGVVFCKKNF